MIQVKIKDIQLWQANYRQGDVQMIARSIQRFGYNRSVSLWRDNVVIAGNHTVKALKYLEDNQADAPKNVIVGKDGDWSIEVTDVSHLDEHEAEAYAIADNRAADIATNDNEQLVSLLSQLHEADVNLFEATGWTDDDLNELLGTLTPPEPVADPGAQMDRAEELNEKWQVKRGDLWVIGNHRLLCGDSTSEEDVKRLMGGECAEMCFTSPPYSDQRDYGENSDLSIDTLKQFISTAKDYVNYFCVNLGIKRANHAIVPYWDEYIGHAQDCGLKLLSWNVWDKKQAGSIGAQDSMFPIEHEWIFVLGSEPKTPNRFVEKAPHSKDREKYYAVDNKGRQIKKRRQPDGSLSYSTHGKSYEYKALGSVIEAQPELSNVRALHSAVMGIDVATGYILAITNEKQIVYDPFGGSGTTMVACEQLARQCRMIEIEEKYCAVILERMQGMGLEPVLST